MPRLITISYRFFATSDCYWLHSDYFFIPIPFFQTLGSLVWSGYKHVLFGWQGRSPRSIHRALWQGTIHNWGLKIYVRTIYLNYFVIFVNSHHLVNYRLYHRSKLSCSHFFLRIENICIILLWEFLTFIHYCDQIGCFKSMLSLMPIYQIYECFIHFYIIFYITEN